MEQLEKQLEEGSQMAEHCKRLLAEARAGSAKLNAEIAELRAAENQQTDERMTKQSERDAQRDEWLTAPSLAMSQLTESKRSQESTAQDAVEIAETARPKFNNNCFFIKVQWEYPL